MHHARDVVEPLLLTSATDATTAQTPVPGPDLHQLHPHPSLGTVQSAAGLEGPGVEREVVWKGDGSGANKWSACKFASVYGLLSPKNLRHATLMQQQGSHRQQQPFYKFLQAHELRGCSSLFTLSKDIWSSFSIKKKSSKNYSYRLKAPKSPDFPCEKDRKRSGTTLALFDGIFLLN